MASFHLFRADCIGNRKNCLYPHAVEVMDGASLSSAVSADYVAVEYREGYRSGDRFLWTDCLALDCDNDHSEDPAAWVTPEIVLGLFPDVCAGFHFSRHHNLEKEGQSARPRFHCFLMIDRMTDAAAYAALKRRLNNLFPFFDQKALDAARFFFGTASPEVVFRAGEMSLQECLDCYYPEDPFMGMPDPGTVIPQGSRNDRMHRFAVRVLKRCGVTEEARRSFLRMAERCDPPLEAEELSAIWRSAVKFYRGTVEAHPEYVKPEAFAKEGGDGTWDDPIPFARFAHPPFPASAAAPVRGEPEGHGGVLSHCPGFVRERRDR